MAPREFLLLPGSPHGSRSAMTCEYRCGNACDKPEPNSSANPRIRGLIEDIIARRTLLKAGLGAAGALVLGDLTALASAASPTAAAARTGEIRLGKVEFTPVAPNVRDAVTLPEAFTHDVVVKWGDRVTRDAPAFDVGHQTPASAAGQFGYNCDYVGVLPLDDRRALLVANHEYTDEQLMFPTGAYTSKTAKRIAMASVGLSVVQIQRRRGERRASWRRSDPDTSRYNRRITASTTFALTGPAAGDPRLRTKADPGGRTVHGTLNNCSGGTTPWGTVLSGEENFDGYFDKSGTADDRYAASYARYGINGRGRGWKDVAPRFDLSTEPHEPFRFGWIVELDPYRPRSTPRKHTMLGRFKHEGANITIARSGHAVCYLGDDERGEYIYKFVSRDKFDDAGTRAARRRNMTLLTRGTLYVARFTGSRDGTGDQMYDGTGQWLRLTSDAQSFVDGMSVADVLIDTRLAADKVAPTRMDRPEDIEPNPVNGRIYCALTNNVRRGSSLSVDEANPLATSMVRDRLGDPLKRVRGNRNGYVLEISEASHDHTAEQFLWNLMLVCGDPQAPETYFAGYPKTQVSAISCPDNVTFDAEGNLWIATNGSALGSNDGLFRVPVSGPERGHVKQFLTVPIGAEACGPLILEDQLSVFTAVQHPGETDGATFANPSSTWPHTNHFPRPGVIVAFKA